ncbi:melanoma-associated antigen 10-like [Tamandua tetradactyla]|uniref:melanoma-associated antigen 10-like n=1 Tax=Tamandua tetradactyla TaxID=48850 RepID=UPI004053EEAF
MSHALKRRRVVLEEGLKTQNETQDSENAQDSSAVEEIFASSSSSPCSSSSFPLSTSSSSSSSSCYPLIPSTPEDVSAPGTPSTPGSPQRACSSHAALEATPLSQSDEGSSCPEAEGSSNLQFQLNAESLLRSAINDKVDDLVKFLLLKYQIKEPITKAEMLEMVIQNYKDHFPVIFREASECMELVFGIAVKEVDPTGECYVLTNALGFTYDEGMSNNHSLPKAGILMFILSIIFMEGNCVPEETIWDMLGVMGVYPGREHYIYGEPRKLLTRDWVQAKYLEYRRVPGSHPVRYEFLWGPRAHAETTKMKVLEFLAKINGSDPSSFPLWYEEALRDEEMRAQARNATMGYTAAGASSSSSSCL